MIRKFLKNSVVTLLSIVWVYSSAACAASGEGDQARNTRPSPHQPEGSQEECHEQDGVCLERAQLVQIVNTERVQSGLENVRLDSQLSGIAHRFAVDMSQRNYFSHVTPEGQTMRMRLHSGNADYGYAGENIARGQESTTVVMQSWMKSPGHRANILKSQFRRIGVAHVGRVWVQVFTD